MKNLINSINSINSINFISSVGCRRINDQWVHGLRPRLVSSVRGTLLALTLLFCFQAAAHGASPPSAPMSDPSCKRILQNDGRWFASICPTTVFADGVGYQGVAVYYFGFLGESGDYVNFHLSVDQSPWAVHTMTRDFGVYSDFYGYNLFEFKYIPYLPSRKELTLDFYFSRSHLSHDEFGSNYRVHLTF